MLTNDDFARTLDELDRLLNDPDVPMEPALIWRLIAEVSERAWDGTLEKILAKSSAALTFKLARPMHALASTIFWSARKSGLIRIGSIRTTLQPGNFALPVASWRSNRAE